VVDWAYYSTYIILLRLQYTDHLLVLYIAENIVGKPCLGGIVRVQSLPVQVSIRCCVHDTPVQIEVLICLVDRFELDLSFCLFGWMAV
jgi:hypothetical protein